MNNESSNCYSSYCESKFVIFVFEVMSDARVKLMEAGYTPGNPFPVEEHVRDGTQNLLSEDCCHICGRLCFDENFAGICHQLYIIHMLKWHFHFQRSYITAFNSYLPQVFAAGVISW